MITVHTAAERPDLWERGLGPVPVWPEYNLHGDVLNRWWGQLSEDLPEFQFVLYDQGEDSVAARGYTAPVAWDGRDETLPDGIDAVVEVLFGAGPLGGPAAGAAGPAGAGAGAGAAAPAGAAGAADTLCALAAEIPPDGRGRGLAVEILAAMRSIGQRHGLRRLIAPVRPSWKERYPLAPIASYVRWRREDGKLLDPWMRVHESLGARVATPLPRSLRITGTVADWETWTGLPFPETGEYVFPRGLATLHIDRENDLGSYWEPNAWMIHPDL